MQPDRALLVETHPGVATGQAIIFLVLSQVLSL